MNAPQNSWPPRSCPLPWRSVGGERSQCEAAENERSGKSARREIKPQKEKAQPQKSSLHPLPRLLTRQHSAFSPKSECATCALLTTLLLVQAEPSAANGSRHLEMKTKGLAYPTTLYIGPKSECTNEGCSPSFLLPAGGPLGGGLCERNYETWVACSQMWRREGIQPEW